LADTTWNKMGGTPGGKPGIDLDKGGSDMRWGGSYDGSVGVRIKGSL